MGGNEIDVNATGSDRIEPLDEPAVLAIFGFFANSVLNDASASFSERSRAVSA